MVDQTNQEYAFPTAGFAARDNTLRRRILARHNESGWTSSRNRNDEGFLTGDDPGEDPGTKCVDTEKLGQYWQVDAGK